MQTVQARICVYLNILKHLKHSHSKKILFMVKNKQNVLGKLIFKNLWAMCIFELNHNKNKNSGPFP